MLSLPTPTFSSPLTSTPDRKGWLPPSYGKKGYHDMSRAERIIVDSYEGESSYTDSLARHLIPTKSSLLQLHA